MKRQCRDCGYEFIEPESPQCPKCGSRNLLICDTDSVKFHERIRLRVSHKDQRRHYRELIRGEELYEKEGKWVDKYRLIDKETDEYHELVTDPETGRVIHECKEPLTEHRGHGSAKHKAQNNESSKDSDS